MALDGMTDETLPRRAMRAEFLDAETEAELARAWRDRRDSTYAVWWIKASIQEFVMRNWSMVRTGSTSSQKALFFNMRRVQAQLTREAAQEGISLDPSQLRQRVAEVIGVPLADVEMMEGRLSGSDYSLNATQSSDDEGREWVETLEDDGATPEENAAESHDGARMRAWLTEAMGRLSEREKYIVRERRLTEEPRTLESLGEELGLSKERIRQLEVQAFGKMRKSLESHDGEVQNFFS